MVGWQGGNERWEKGGGGQGGREEGRERMKEDGRKGRL